MAACVASAISWSHFHLPKLIVLFSRRSKMWDTLQPLLKRLLKNYDKCLGLFKVPEFLVVKTFGCPLTQLLATFDIHISVHLKYNSKLQPTRCNVSWFIYFYRCSTCFRRFLRPSSGAHNCTYSFRMRWNVSSISSTIAASSSIGWQYLKL
jgi:hypothetical protein